MNGSESSPAARSITVRPVASIEELIRIEQMIAAQFPSHRSAPTRGLAARKARLERDPTLMLVAELGGAAIGRALAHQAGEAVEVDAIALRPEARRLGIGRQLMETIETEAIRLGWWRPARPS